MERSVHDSLCVVKRVMESKNVVVGGGAVEAALSIYLENFATTLSSRYVNVFGDLTFLFKVGSNQEVWMLSSYLQLNGPIY